MALKVILVFLLFLCTSAFTKETPETIKIAIVDTGLALDDSRFKDHICENGHENYVDGTLKDTHGHGTHIAGLIKKYAGEGNYCFLIYKYFKETNPGYVNKDNEIKAFNKAIENGAQIINFSSGGPEFDEDEFLVIKNHLHVVFVVAAGNENKNLDIPGNEYYPASYFLPNEKVIGNACNGIKEYASNWGSKVTSTENGCNVLSTSPCSFFDGYLYCNAYMSGTSQSTAIYTGKLIRSMLDAKQSFSK